MPSSTLPISAILFLLLFANVYAATTVSFRNKTQVMPALQVSASASPSVATTGQQISFSCTATGGVIPYASYHWNFGDGTTGTGASPTHAYSSIGTFQAVCKVIDSQTTSATGSTTEIIA